MRDRASTATGDPGWVCSALGSLAVAVVMFLQPLPLEVDFSVPVEGEADVRLDTRVRLQFSRGLDVASIEGRIRLSYSASDSTERGEPQAPALAFTTHYDADTRVLEMRPTEPLARFREVKVELLDGIRGADDSALLRPWRLLFLTGGS